MGTWGPGLYLDDMTLDVKNDYIDYLRKKKTPAEAVELLLASYRPGESEDGYLFWLAVASIQWKYGHLTEDIRQKALSALTSGADEDRWREGTPADRSERAQMLRLLKEQLESPQPPMKKVAGYRGQKSKWKLGEVYSFQFIDFQAAYFPPRELERFRPYIPLSFSFGAFHVVDIQTVFEDWKEVYNEVPVVAIYDWIGAKRPILQDLVDVPILEYGPRKDRHRFFRGTTPAKLDYTRNHLELLGTDMRLPEGNYSDFSKTFKMWSALQIYLAEEWYRRQGDG